MFLQFFPIFSSKSANSTEFIAILLEKLIRKIIFNRFFFRIHILYIIFYFISRYAEAESILTGGGILRSKELSDEEIISEFGDESCFVFKLLAIIAAKTSKTAHSAEMYKKSLKLNPFLWDSFEQLCNLGYQPDPNDVFNVSKMDNFSLCHGVNPVVNYVNNNLSEHNYTINNSSSQNNVDSHYKR